MRPALEFFSFLGQKAEKRPRERKTSVFVKYVYNTGWAPYRVYRLLFISLFLEQ